MTLVYVRIHLLHTCGGGAPFPRIHLAANDAPAVLHICLHGVQGQLCQNFVLLTCAHNKYSIVTAEKPKSSSENACIPIGDQSDYRNMVVFKYTPKRQTQACKQLLRRTSVSPSYLLATLPLTRTCVNLLSTYRSTRVLHLDLNACRTSRP